MIVPTTTVEVSDYIRRSEQGRTQPFICRCDDGNIYFLKGQAAGKGSLLREWLAGCLAKAFGLPIADFSLVNVPEDLILYSGKPELRELGSGWAFGSKLVAGAQELTVGGLDLVDATTQMDVFMFDWWVRNEDRYLGEQAGNPNLLWDTMKQQLVVIDHNLAFDPHFDRVRFLSDHAFARSMRDFFHSEDYRRRFTQALSIWDQACSLIPEGWWFIDPEQTVPTTFSLKSVLGLLNSYQEAEFWRLDL